MWNKVDVIIKVKWRENEVRKSLTQVKLNVPPVEGDSSKIFGEIKELYQYNRSGGA